MYDHESLQGILEMISKLKLKNFLLDLQYEEERLIHEANRPTLRYGYEGGIDWHFNLLVKSRLKLIDDIFKAIEEGRFDK